MLRSSKIFPRQSTNSTQLTQLDCTTIDKHSSLAQWPWRQQM